VIKYLELVIIFKYENKIFKKKIDIEALKHSYQIGLDTLLVYAINYEYKLIYINVKKYSAWAVQSQGWNLTELAGICPNGGTCGLMR